MHCNHHTYHVSLFVLLSVLLVNSHQIGQDVLNLVYFLLISHAKFLLNLISYWMTRFIVHFHNVSLSLFLINSFQHMIIVWLLHKNKIPKTKLLCNKKFVTETSEQNVNFRQRKQT